MSGHTSAIDDWIAGRIIPRRDHTPKIDVAMRTVRMSAILGGLPDKGFGPSRDEFGCEFPDLKQLGAKEDRVGDDQCWGLWRFDPSSPENRGIPSLANVFPAMLELSSRPTDGAAAGGALTLGTVSKIDLEASLVRNTKWDADTRYLREKVSLHPLTQLLPRGIPGLVTFGTEERSQENLFFPSAQVLVAPWRAGSPELGNWVYEATADNGLDLTRRAHLQSAWRVYKIPATCGPNLYGTPGTRGLAIQMSVARGGFAGRATVADFPDSGDMTVSSSAQAIAGASHHVGGLFHVGAGAGDQHTDATNEDGDTIGPVHANPRAPWFVNAGQDAPFLFTQNHFRATKGWGDLREVELVIDNTVMHPTPCGPRKGYHRWQVPVPYFFPPPPPPPPPPPTETFSLIGLAADVGFSIPGIFPDVDFYTVPGIGSDVDGGGGKGGGGKTSTGEDGGGALVNPGPNGDEGGAGTSISDIANVIQAVGGVDTSVGKAINDAFGGTIVPSVPFAMNFLQGLPADGAGGALVPPRPAVPRVGKRDAAARTRFGLDLPVLSFVNETSYPALIFKPQHFARSVRDLRYSSAWGPDDAAKLYESTPAVARLEAIGNQYGATWTRTTGRGVAGRGVGRYRGGTATGALWFFPPELGAEAVLDGTEPSSFSTTTFGFYKTYLAFGKPLKTGLPSSGYSFYYSPDSNAIFGQTRDASGTVTATDQLWPRTAIADQTTPKGYLSGFTLEQDTTYPSVINVTGGICRDSTNGYDIAVDDPGVDYLTNGGPLFNDALVAADTALTGTATTGNWAVPLTTFGVGNLSGSILPLLLGRTLTGAMAVSARSGVTLLQKITGSGGSLFLTELAIGDVIGNATCGHGAVAQIDSDTVCWIVKEFSDFSGSTYTGQTFKCYENVQVQLGATPSCRISEISKDGAHIYSPSLFNGGAGAMGLNVVVGQPSPALVWTTPVITTPSWIYLWARRTSGGSTTLSWSTQRTTPYTPATLSGYSIWRRVGVLPIATDNFVYYFSQVDLGRSRVYELEYTNNSELRAVTTSSAAAWTRVELKAGVAPTARRAIVTAYLVNPAGRRVLYFRKPTIGAATVERTRFITADTGGYVASELTLATDAAQAIEWTLSAADANVPVNVYIRGYYDTP